MTSLRARRDLLWREVDGEIVLLDPNRGRYFGIEGAGAEYWTMIQDGVSPEEAEARLLARYDVSPGRLRDDLKAFSDQVRKHRLAE